VLCIEVGDGGGSPQPWRGLASPATSWEQRRKELKNKARQVICLLGRKQAQQRALLSEEEVSRC
jgi:hypothetical protein